MPKRITLEEIGCRAVALSEARSAIRRHNGSPCEIRYVGRGADDDPDEGPCWHPDAGIGLDEWCEGCKVREGLLAARRAASRRLTSAIRSWKKTEAKR